MKKWSRVTFDEYMRLSSLPQSAVTFRFNGVSDTGPGGHREETFRQRLLRGCCRTQFSCCIVPRSSDCVLGGTSEENDWNVKPDQQTAAKILEKCRVICPDLGNAEILAHKVGLRPGRNQVRLELERISSDSSVIHNYGHGGAGFTLCWGCADDVLALAKSS